ncbi:tyrosine protein phosphatase yvh1 [Tieghemiomyces parasiticus]|uniref:Tyrosine protein phosphatase yvh1 n=1 Tax=Tieghemiomyces parasiticus TaxID=78921 RepID=A0A9W8DYV1_9FUNG|nr:tyrosine protein phosphatase yvh1 [Tieghemiomyces parasiticus]
MADAHLIHPHLYLGNYDAASDRRFLEHARITHILSMGTDLHPRFPGQFKYLQIDIYDMKSEDIMQHFPETYAFIRNAIMSGGNVLVHCHAGISRSASVVIAYLMKSLDLPLASAYQLVKEKREIIWPNEGFRRQLEMYESMGNEIRPSHPVHRRHETTQKAERMQAANHAQVPRSRPPPTFSSFEHHNIPIQMVGSSPKSPTQAPTRAAPSAAHATHKIGYRCKTCRSVLFSDDFMVKHAAAGGHKGGHSTMFPASSCVIQPISEVHTSTYSEKRYLEIGLPTPPTSASNGSGNLSSCSSYFIEPMKWISGANDGTHSGRIDCFKCGTKLGSYDWSGE